MFMDVVTDHFLSPACLDVCKEHGPWQSARFPATLLTSGVDVPCRCRGVRCTVSKLYSYNMAERTLPYA